MTKSKWYKWTVEFKVHSSCVADGFDLTDERAHDMLANDLCFAFNSELKAKVLSAPHADRIAKEQGYKSAADKVKKDAGDWS